MAASSSFVRPTQTGPQVFISFRGEDVRKGFISFLAPALRDANINVFIDEDELLGTDLVELLKRIEESEIALVIFSKEYTTSDWCLDELAKMKERKDQGRLKVIPIFYKVEPSVVKHLRGQFGDNFRDLKRSHQHQPERTRKWEEALVSIPETIGMPLAERSDRTDSEFINLLIGKIQKLLESMIGRPETEANRQGGSMVPTRQPAREASRQGGSMVSARQLEITHFENPQNWAWSFINETPEKEAIEIATLNGVYWLDLKGNFSLRGYRLTPETKYEVVFVVKLEQIADGWEVPVNLDMKLTMRDQSETEQKKTLYLDDVCVGDEWVDVKAGDFVVPPKDAPPKDVPVKIYFRMYQCDLKIQKTGLVVKGVAIRAVK